MELFHALNRGVDKRTIFLDNQDRARFVHDMYEFNDTKLASNTRRNAAPMFGLRNRTLEREIIVDIHGWCLMDNHYHLLLSERVENGISFFLRKLNVGYANYFNERYKRQGTLFQGRTKKIHVNSEAYFLHILNYIHLNPLDLRRDCKNWRLGHIRGADAALTHLEKYRWSSYRDYCGKKNFPSILTKDLFSSVFKDYQREVREHLRSIDLTTVKPFLLE